MFPNAQKNPPGVLNGVSVVLHDCVLAEMEMEKMFTDFETEKYPVCFFHWNQERQMDNLGSIIHVYWRLRGC